MIVQNCPELCVWSLSEGVQDAWKGALRILAYITLQTIVQWTLITLATQFFLGKTSTSSETNFGWTCCVGIPREYSLIKLLGSIPSPEDTSLWFNHNQTTKNHLSCRQSSKLLPTGRREYRDHLESKLKLASKKLGVSCQPDSTSHQNPVPHIPGSASYTHHDKCVLYRTWVFWETVWPVTCRRIF